MASVETRPSQYPVAAPALRAAKARPHAFKRGATAIVFLGIVVAFAVYAARNFGMRQPGAQTLWNDGAAIVAVAIFAATYLVIALGKLPGYHLDRSGAALLGASL